MKTEIPITLGTSNVVFTDDSHNYKDVLDSFAKSHRIAIATYSLSRSDIGPIGVIKKKVSGSFRCELVTNIPAECTDEYLRIINPSQYPEEMRSFVNPKNHSKIIVTDTMSYIGSANLSRASEYNGEAGVVIKDKSTAARIYDEIFVPLRNKSIAFFGSQLESISIMIAQLRSQIDSFIWLSTNGLSNRDVEGIRRLLIDVSNLSKKNGFVPTELHSSLESIDLATVGKIGKLLDSVEIQRCLEKESSFDFDVLKKLNHSLEQPGSDNTDALADAAYQEVEDEFTKSRWRAGEKFDELRSYLKRLSDSLTADTDEC